MLARVLFGRGFSVGSLKATDLTARKYLRSLSESALHYRPHNIRSLTNQENLKDRIVQTFFDVSPALIKVSESKERLQEIGQFSTPAHSYYSLILPFANNQNLRKKMIQFYSNHIRTGRILELMDYIAANVAYRYCVPLKDEFKTRQQLQFYSVTACIDEIEFYQPVLADIDCELSGYVCCVGRSSMEIQIDVQQDIGGDRRLNCSARFVMVARDKASNKSYKVPELNFEGEKEIFKIIHELGQQRQVMRRQEAKKSLEITPPTYQESCLVHEKMLVVTKEKNPARFMAIDSTTARTTLLMHSEDRNLHGKIFGGYVLKLAYELAWVCMYKFLRGGFPVVTQIEDVQFLNPVQIGTSLDYLARIVYVQGNLAHVIVSCKNITANGQERLTNVLHIIFMHNEDTATVPQVYPETIENMNQFIEGIRKIKKVLKY